MISYQRANGTALVASTPGSATNVAQGIIRIATDAEALAGTAQTEAVNEYQLALLSTIPEQDIPYVATTTVARASTMNITSNSDGSVIFIVAQGSSTAVLDIFRLERDVISKNYNITHATTLTPGGSGGQVASMAVLGNYLYVFSTLAATNACNRYAIADLSGVTTITISGTAWTSGQTAFSDGTDLYVYNTTNQFYRYTVSGTTMTNAATVTYTSA